MSRMNGTPRCDGALKLASTCSVAHELMCCQFNSTGTLLATGTTNGSVTVFQPATGSPVYQLYSPQFERLPVTAVRFMKGDQKNILLAAYASGHVRHWHVSTSQCLSTIKEERQTLAAAFAPDGLSFATAGSDNKVYIYDEATHKLVKTLEPSMSSSVMDGHMSRVFALTYHPSDSRILLSAGWDDTVQYWDTREYHSIRKISGPHVCGDALDIEPTTLNVVTASWRYHDALQVWDFDSGGLLSTLQPDLKSKLYGVCWTSPETLLAGGTQKHVAVLVDSMTDKVLGEVSELEHGVYGVHSSQEAGLLAIAAGMKVLVASSAVAVKSNIFMTEEI